MLFKNLFKRKPETKTTVVPWQLCPKCNGEGSIFNAKLHPDSVHYYGWQKCDLCDGTMVIPMAVIPEKKS